MKVLVTGAAGYIGSHTLLALLETGYEAVGVDNFCNSSPRSLDHVQKLTGKRIECHKVDVCDPSPLRPIFAAHAFDAVMHFAALKAVGESVTAPLSYYRNNLDSMITLCELTREYKVATFILSSSASVYGSPEQVPLTERAPVQPTNPYGWTKAMCEQILRDCTVAQPTLRAIALRYFNAVGAHESGELGEDPKGKPENLMPYLAQVAVGRREQLYVYGTDYPTPDGTGVRDYIHVMDLADAHIKALEGAPRPGFSTYNLGSNRPYSVLEVIHTFGLVSGRSIPYTCVPRRPGDVALCYTNAALAEEGLGWRAEKGLYDICMDTWRWQLNHPKGYEEASTPSMEVSLPSEYIDLSPPNASVLSKEGYS